MGRVLKGTEKEGHVGARYRIDTIGRQENKLAIKYHSLGISCNIHTEICAKFFFLTTVELISLGSHPHDGA